MSLIVVPEIIEWFPQTAIGEVEQTITRHQRGRVKFMATTWFARFYQPDAQIEALPGMPVKVIGREGLTLLVVPLGDEEIPQMPLVDRSEVNQSVLLGLIQQMGSRLATWLSQ